MIPSLYSTRFRPKRHCPDGRGYWSGHLPFGADLVDSIKPKILVELGTYHGESYFGFCQAIQERAIDCRSYAVDTWDGDSSTGRYGPSVYRAVSAYNEALYGSFSSLLRMTFDEATVLFADRTIDLLHLDGCHTYTAAKRDFETWLPKVSEGGVILIHDIAVRKGDFGVWRLWEEIADRFPSFAFWHSCGLGMILANAETAKTENPFLAALIDKMRAPEAIRDYYALCAERLSGAPRAGIEGPLKCQIYSPSATGYSEGNSEVSEVVEGSWTTVELEVPVPAGRLRFDPVNCASVIEISEIQVRCPSTRRVLWEMDAACTDDILCGGTAVRIPDENKLVVLSYGDDPQLNLPLVAPPEEAASLLFRCRMRIDLSFSLMERSFEQYSDALREQVKLRASLADSRSEVDGLRAFLETANRKLTEMELQLDQQSRVIGEARSQSAMLRESPQQAKAALAELQTSLEVSRSEVDGLRESLASSEAARAEISSALETANSKLAEAGRQLDEQSRESAGREGALRSEIADLQVVAELHRSQASELQRNGDSLRSSYSWRVTAPLRILASPLFKMYRLLRRIP